jgi:hypothetical protein
MLGWILRIIIHLYKSKYFLGQTTGTVSYLEYVTLLQAHECPWILSSAKQSTGSKGAIRL